jgi:hypothetical protein
LLLDDGAPLEDDEYVELLAAGTSSKGEFHCAACGYGVTITRSLPTCPMCAGGSWQRAAWSPLARAAQRVQQGL